MIPFDSLASQLLFSIRKSLLLNLYNFLFSPTSPFFIYLFIPSLFFYFFLFLLFFISFSSFALTFHFFTFSSFHFLFYFFLAEERMVSSIASLDEPPGPLSKFSSMQGVGPNNTFFRSRNLFFSFLRCQTSFFLIFFSNFMSIFSQNFMYFFSKKFMSIFSKNFITIFPAAFIKSFFLRLISP